MRCLATYALVVTAVCFFVCAETSYAQTPVENKALSKMEKSPECKPAAKDPALWDKSLLFGLNLTDGNSNTLLVNVKGDVSRDYESNIWKFALSGSYGEQDEDEDEGEEDSGTETTQQDVKSEASYKRLFTERFFGGFGVNYKYDKIADIDYRVILKPVLGYFLLRDDTVKFSVEAGPGYVFERVGDESDDYLAPLIGERFEWTISETSKLYQSAEVLFDVNNSDNFLVTSEAGVEAAINSYLSLVLAITDIYDGEPAEDKEENDLVIGSALKVTL